jgi:hypothetical protein
MVRDSDNLIPLHPGGDLDDGDLPLPVEELSETVSVIGRCLAEIGSEFEPGAWFSGISTTPLLLHMTTVEQQLENLAEITVTTWPDVRWALHFCDARIRALTYIRASATWSRRACSYHEPPRARQHVPVFAEFGAMSRALRDVRDLIVKRYPQTRGAY